MKWYARPSDDGEPEIDIREQDEDLSLGYSLLREMARQGDAALYELAPGVWLQRDERPNPPSN